MVSQVSKGKEEQDSLRENLPGLSFFDKIGFSVSDVWKPDILNKNDALLGTKTSDEGDKLTEDSSECKDFGVPRSKICDSAEKSIKCF